MQDLHAPPLAPSPASSLKGVLGRMEQIAAALPPEDGLAAFNLLYMEVTYAVVQAIEAGSFSDPDFLSRLDVVFANFYFAAVRLHFADSPTVPRAWSPLLLSRTESGISPLRFALAGMNAHINHDLCLALVQTCRERGIEPKKGSRQHRDYLQINQTLQAKESEVKERFLTGVLRRIDQLLGPLDDAVVMWNIVEARDLAWDHAETLWQLRESPTLTADYLAVLEQGVGLASRGLLSRAL
jgi:hypothetical protein